MPDESNRAHSALRGAVFDAIPSQLAVLDEEGVIVETNDAWSSFGLENGMALDTEMVGEDYLAVCQSSEDPSTTRAYEGLRAILDGERESFGFEYPCHSPERKRWFTMRAIPFEHDSQQYVLVMHQNITERRLAEQAVEERNETLELVAGVISHDLRNPLTVASGQLALLDGDDDSERYARIERSLDRMNDIIEDALVLARQGGVDGIESVSLSVVARDAWEQVDTEGATLSVETECVVQADRSLLAQLLENLFRNSVEHSDTDALTVRVGVREDSVFVADDGPGIPESKREQVFQAGFTTDGREGTGLGLSIVRHIAEAHGWSVAATESEHGGARIDISGVDIS